MSDMLVKRKEIVELIVKRKGLEKDVVASVMVCIDKSGSMGHLYRNGTVQYTLERLIPISMKFDDDGQVPVVTFNTSCSREETLNLENLDGYVRKYLPAPYSGTNYAPAISKIIDEYKKGDSHNPTFVIFITDGENADRKETERALREASKYPIYFQFVGIGDEYFDFLMKLDDLTGREFDNAGFISIQDLDKVNDEELYTMLLDEFLDLYKSKY